LDRAHHLDVAHVVNRARAVLRLEGAIKHGKVLLFDAGSALDRAVLLDVGRDGP
jgi:hypothetical protein